MRVTGVPGKLDWVLVHLSFLVGWGNRLGVLARWGYALSTGNRSERVILEAVGAAGPPAQTASGEEAAQARQAYQRRQP